MLVDTTQPVDRDRSCREVAFAICRTGLQHASSTRCPSPYTKGDLRLCVTGSACAGSTPHTGTQIAGLRRTPSGMPDGLRTALPFPASPTPPSSTSAVPPMPTHHFAYPDHHTFTAADLDETLALGGM